MESSLEEDGDITYMSELTPHPAAKSFPGVFSLLGEGLNSQTLRYNLCSLRSTSCLLIEKIVA